MPVLARSLSLPLRLLAALLALYVLGVSAYHVHRVRPRVPGQLYAVTVISGVAAIWALLSALVICCLKRPSLLLPTAVMDLLLTGGFVAIAVLLRRHARTQCFGSALCKVDKAAFSVSVANAVFFLILALLSFKLYRAYKRNRAFGPGPENGYSTTPAAGGVGRKHNNRGSRRWSDETAMTENTAATSTQGFTRGQPRATPALGYTTPAQAGYREPGRGRGAFDPELPANHHHQHAAKTAPPF